MDQQQRHQRNARSYLGLDGAALGVTAVTSDAQLRTMAAQDEAEARAADVHLVPGSAFDARREQRDGLREHNERQFEMAQFPR
jgi:hypothetical protein